MLLNEINAQIKEIKRQSTCFLTNIVYSKLNAVKEYPVICKENAIVVLVKEEYRMTAFYAASDERALVSVLKDIPAGTYAEVFHGEKEDEMAAYFVEGGFSCYAEYVRETVTYLENPYRVPAEGKLKLLQQFYDPEIGETPKMEDAEEIFMLCKEKFDPVVDDIFSVDEWKEAIANHECLIVRENGKIVTVYKWRVEGKKLYGNILINLGPANLSYSLGRRVFEECWNEGIRTSYSWKNTENTKALARRFPYDPDIVQKRMFLYDTIYVKNVFNATAQCL